MFDIGVNLTSTQFAKDREQVVTRAREAGLTGMLITGTNALRASRRRARAAPSRFLLVDGWRSSPSCQRMVGGYGRDAASPGGISAGGRHRRMRTRLQP